MPAKSAREILIISGLSGSGKTAALKVLEDEGYFVIDNLPAELLQSFSSLLSRSPSYKRMRRIALGMDARTLTFVKNYTPHVRALARTGCSLRILFLEADDASLIRRFSETRHRHPLAPETNPLDGIRRERKLLNPLRQDASHVIDTTHLSVHELKRAILSWLEPRRSRAPLSANVITFGYKYGIPLHADLVLDVRFLPNPHFVPKLRPRSGRHPAVKKYLESQPQTHTFLEMTRELIHFLIKHFQEEGKAYFTLAIGCTGGRHRSVFIAEKLAEFLKQQKFPVRIHHRDLQRGETL